MSVAELLDVADDDSITITAIRRAWPRWRRREPALWPVGDDARNIHAWTTAADRESADQALRALARLGSRTGDDDSLAATALAWAMLAGARTLVRRLEDLSPEADAIVASHLWASARTVRWDLPGNVATSIMRSTRRDALRDLGVGFLAEKVDRTWMHSIPLSPDSTIWGHLDHDTSFDDRPADDLTDLFDQALRTGDVSPDDVRMLTDLAAAADRAGTSARTSSGGLLGPGAQVVAADWGVTDRTVRRRARRALDQLHHIARGEPDPPTPSPTTTTVSSLPPLIA